MPESVTYTASVRHDDVTYENTLSLSGDSVERATPTVPAAKSGTLTTRTDANTGTFTMSSGHGFTTGNKVDVFWAGGQRRAMDATVTGDSVVLDGGAGDDLPALNTAVTAMVPVDVPFVVDGDDVIALAAHSPVPGYVVWFDDENTPAAIPAATFVVDRTESGLWASGNGVTNPLDGEITTSVKFSHGSTSAQTMTAVAVMG